MSETKMDDIDMPAFTGRVLDDAGAEELANAKDLAERRNLYRIGTILTVVGVVCAALGVLPVLVMGARVAVFVVGLIALYMGVRRLGLARFGSDFDLTFILSCAWLTVLIVAAIAAPLLPLAEHEDTTKTLSAKSYASPSLFSSHPLGTNNFGLDMLARSIYGARSSLIVAVAAVAIGILVGGAIGILAGYFGGWVDRVVGILTNSLLAVPALILLIALASVLQPNLRNVSFALAVLAIPSMVRNRQSEHIGVLPTRIRPGGTSDGRHTMAGDVAGDRAERGAAAAVARHGDDLGHDRRRGVAELPRPRHPAAVAHVGNDLRGPGQRLRAAPVHRPGARRVPVPDGVLVQHGR